MEMLIKPKFTASSIFVMLISTAIAVGIGNAIGGKYAFPPAITGLVIVFMIVLFIALSGGFAVRYYNKATIQGLKSIIEAEKTIIKGLKAQGEGYKNGLLTIDKLTKELQEEQELSLKQAGELTTTKQALAGAYEKIQVLEKDLAGANEGLASADELLSRAGKELAGVKQELAGAKIEINTCKSELAGEKSQARKYTPYIALAKQYNAYKVAESAFKSVNSKSDAEGKEQAKKAFSDAKQALDEVYSSIYN